MALFVGRPAGARTLLLDLEGVAMSGTNGNGTSGNGSETNDSGTSGNGEQSRWALGGQPFSRYVDFLAARDRRVGEFLERAGGETEVAPVDGTIPGDAAPETFSPEPAWPIAE